MAAESERPVLLFSGGKDSAVLLHLASKAFKPGRIPFPVLHVDTGHNFTEVIDFRDPRSTEERASWSPGSRTPSTRAASPTPGRWRRGNRLQTTTLLDAINATASTPLSAERAADEDKARAKERVLSFRDSFGQWDPKRQRPELWQLYQGSVRPGEHLRAFPLSDWTELDIWQYIAARGSSSLPSTTRTSGRSLSATACCWPIRSGSPPEADEEVRKEMVRFRTVGDATCTGAVRSDADTVEEIIARGLGVPDLRAGSHPGRRPLLGDRHGGPKARGVLLGR